eukprot:249121-Chlamydomonas_euryale.AAC.6
MPTANASPMPAFRTLLAPCAPRRLTFPRNDAMLPDTNADGARGSLELAAMATCMARRSGSVRASSEYGPARAASSRRDCSIS